MKANLNIAIDGLSAALEEFSPVVPGKVKKQAESLIRVLTEYHMKDIAELEDKYEEACKFIKFNEDKLKTVQEEIRNMRKELMRSRLAIKLQAD